MSGIDWVWCPNGITFGPSYSMHAPTFGKVPHEFMSPHWVFEFDLPDKDLGERRDIEKALAESEGKIPFNVYDPRCPYPAHYLGKAGKNAPASIIPTLTVKAIDKATSTIIVSGQDRDLITHGDPIAFTYDDVRYYFKSKDDLRLTGSDQVLRVFLRPRVSLTGLSIDVDRIRPTCRFDVDINNTGGKTERGMTNFSLRGIENWRKL